MTVFLRMSDRTTRRRFDEAPLVCAHTCPMGPGSYCRADERVRSMDLRVRSDPSAIHRTRTASEVAAHSQCVTSVWPYHHRARRGSRVVAIGAQVESRSHLSCSSPVSGRDRSKVSHNECRTLENRNTWHREGESQHRRHRGRQLPPNSIPLWIRFHAEL